MATTPANSEDLRRTWRRDMSNGLEMINSTITGMVTGFGLVMIALWASHPHRKPHNHGNSTLNYSGNNSESTQIVTK